MSRTSKSITGLDKWIPSKNPIKKGRKEVIIHCTYTFIGTTSFGEQLSQKAKRQIFDKWVALHEVPAMASCCQYSPAS